VASRDVVRRHHPRKRMIQYAGPLMFNSSFTKYWMPAFRGHDD